MFGKKQVILLCQRLTHAKGAEIPEENKDVGKISVHKDEVLEQIWSYGNHGRSLYSLGFKNVRNFIPKTQTEEATWRNSYYTEGQKDKASGNTI